MRVLGAIVMVMLAVGCASLSSLGFGNSRQSEWIVKTSPYTASDTLDRLAAEVETRGGRVFARINHSAGAQAIGQEMTPTQVLIFGDPRMGTPLIQQRRTAGLDLPARVLAWEEDGTTLVVYTAPKVLAKRYGISPEDAAVTRFADVLDSLTDVATNTFGE